MRLVRVWRMQDHLSGQPAIRFEFDDAKDDRHRFYQEAFPLGSSASEVAARLREMADTILSDVASGKF